MRRSAIERSSSIEVESAVSPIMRTSPRIDDCGPRVGDPAPAGRLFSISESFSDTVCRARYMSVPQSNSIHTTEKPEADEERTRFTPVAPLMLVSMGKLTVFSTSSGAKPGASVIATTVGALRSGNMSTSVRNVTATPRNSRIAESTTTTMRLLSESPIILLSIGRKCNQ